MTYLPNIAFYAMAVALIVTSLGVVTMRNVFYGAVFLGPALTVVAGLFILCGADFLGAAQLLVYVGGIMIIMLFVIMLSPQPRHPKVSQRNRQWLAGLIISAAMGGVLIKALDVFKGSLNPTGQLPPTTANLGRLLLGDMLLPFEVVSLILLSALVGAVLFGQDKK
jgi:NADH-quinone oxidoreductase subunit J